MKYKNVELGIFIPLSAPKGYATPINSTSAGRLPFHIHSRLWERLESSELNIVKDLSLSQSFISNNQLFFMHEDELIVPKKYIWYCEVDRKPTGGDLTNLKLLSKSSSVFRDPYAFSMAVDKFTAYCKLRQQNIPVADSLLVSSDTVHLAEKIIRSWGAVLLKPRIGGYGKGVTLFESYESLRDALEYFSFSNSSACSANDLFHIERYYENKISDWLSVTIVNGNILFGYRKHESTFSLLGPGKFKVYNKDQIGGNSCLCVPNAEQRDIFMKAYRAIGLEVIGFDMIVSNGTPVIIDVNTFPAMHENLFEEAKVNGGDVFFNMLTKICEMT